MPAGWRVPCSNPAPGRIIEFLWVSLALFDHDGAAPGTGSVYRSLWLDLYSAADARGGIRQGPAETPDGEHVDMWQRERVAPLQSRDDPIISQIGSLDLIRRTGSDLFGRENAIVDQPPHGVIGDTQRRGSLAHRQPLAVFLGGTVSRYLVDRPE
jgi:hypothetical protein